MSGYVKSYRERFEHPLLSGDPLCRIAAWDWLVANACENGEVKTAVKSLSDAWLWPKRKIWGFLHKLSDAEMILLSAGQTKGDRLTILICEYARYAGKGFAEPQHWMPGSSVRKAARLRLARGRYGIPAKVKAQVMERDGSVCRYCGNATGPFELDHVMPWSRGGRDTVANLVVACKPCNARKKDRTPTEMGWTTI